MIGMKFDGEYVSQPLRNEIVSSKKFVKMGLAK